MRILVTGGAGYVGSHICKLLHARGHAVAVIDNLSRGHAEFVKWGPLFQLDILDRGKVEAALRQFGPDVVIHCAAFAYVGESVAEPARYYHNNVHGTLCLLDAMLACGVKRLVVSSSCATYGVPAEQPISETTELRPVNPYGASKAMMERICNDYDAAYGLKCVSLRYFNAAGCDFDGEIGEWHEPEPHLIPRAILAALNRAEPLAVFGADYPTHDGTCIRDYIHVNDLADAHLKAASHLFSGGPSRAYNLGVGKGYSVLEVIAAVEKALGRAVPRTVSGRRAGDPPMLVADSSLAREELQWTPAASDIETVVASAARWFAARNS